MADSKKFYRKRQNLWSLITKIKLWPSRNGSLHGILSIDIKGDFALITTHCGLSFNIRNSKNSRAARWLRNKFYEKPCTQCRVPDWKIEKFGKTIFAKRHGSTLPL